VAKLSGEITRIMAQPDVKERAAALAVEYVGGSPEDLSAFLVAETAKWGKVVKAAGLQPE
jgi:tripartite-type tricarboxylate transporter receptor subunit TctC